MSVYIQSATQISAQAPLTDVWFDSPIYHNEKKVLSIDPNFPDYLSPLMSRRMCNLLKRAIVASRLTLQKASVGQPDAIISGTGLGCIENTEKFLYSLWENEEKYLQPSFFMQSTHNIISSAIAIDLKCHGYNNTFVHRGVSFENALLDAFFQFRQERIRNVLVGGYDELTPDYYIFFDRAGIWDFSNQDVSKPKTKCFAGEAAMSMLLQTEKNEQTLCELNGIELLYRPSTEQIRYHLDSLLGQADCTVQDIDAVVVGTNSNPANDAVYDNVVAQLFSRIPVMHYKHLFGQSFISPALGTYAASICLHKQFIPAHLLADSEENLNGIRRILLYNHYQNKSHSLVLLSQC
ncbi:MAG: beta-ketoacyl synthase chain length factor [Tannerella sp.]|jgi:3-oxoacyl-(acyl-carrier-protein) synthase|nr:beta-ketoacyl synthase chain length factor [Tannerella sp.]